MKDISKHFRNVHNISVAQQRKIKLHLFGIDTSTILFLLKCMLTWRTAFCKKRIYTLDYCQLTQNKKSSVMSWNNKFQDKILFLFQSPISGLKKEDVCMYAHACKHTHTHTAYRVHVVSKLFIQMGFLYNTYALLSK